MAIVEIKMAPLILVLIVAINVNGHRDLKPGENDRLSTSDSSSSSGSFERADAVKSTEERTNRRRSEKGKEWQYEGLPIELPVRRNGGPLTTTTTTEPTTKAYPPLDARYRRIYNPDETAVIEDYPFMAAVLVNKHLWCGGVILSRDRVMTAAHCLQLQYNNRFFREYVKMLTVRVGSTNATSGGDVLRVVEISFHPNYKPSTLEFNVALLRVHKNMTFDDKEIYRKVAFTREPYMPVDVNIAFLGWGSTLASGGSGQVLLQKVVLPIYDFADCQEIYGRELVTRTNFCAGYITLAKNVCNHDAGGPAILNNQLVGILSFSSKRCDRPDQPAVFTSVGAMSEWLDNLIERSDIGDEPGLLPMIDE